MNNLIFSIAALLFTASSIAQLYVKPNGTDASYIYVKDEVLFVEDEINLTENPSGATEASIYFRDGAQLIQGDAVASTNTGTGYISILQTDLMSDAWDYAYWGSPVGDQTISGTGNKPFGATRFFGLNGDPNLTNNPNYLLGTESTANVPTSSLNGEWITNGNPNMRISSRWLYTYTSTSSTATNSTWSRIYSGSTVVPGRGFTMKGLNMNGLAGNHDQTYDFRGRPNNGNITTPILAPDPDPNGPKNLSLSGNPYPSALDLNKVFFDNPEIEKFMFWDEDHSINSHYYVDNKGGYGVWLPMTGGYDPSLVLGGLYAPAPFLNYNNDGSTGIGQTGVGSDDYERRFAPVGQGFMLYGMTNVAPGSLITYNNSQRVYMSSSGMSGFRTNDSDTVVNDGAIDVISTSPPDNRIPHLRLNTYFNETHMRQLVLAFSNESTDGYDRGLDGQSPMDSTSDVYFPISINDEKKLPYVIQTVPFDVYKQIPYTIELEVLTRVAITAVEEIKFAGSAYLYDNVEDTYQEITGDRAAELYLPAGTYEDRFFISFVNRHRTQQVAIENSRNQVLEDVDFFQNNPAQQLEVANPEGYNIASANIFGMSGKLVYTASNLGNNNRLTFPTGNLSDGIYLVMLTTTDNIAVNYKITVSNK